MILNIRKYGTSSHGKLNLKWFPGRARIFGQGWGGDGDTRPPNVIFNAAENRDETGRQGGRVRNVSDA
ncbi:hypothetical protein GWI33_014189 [Rhynchophorus ferrugineus]|uniref:Uncharacterized protein n=1 Tax=Rhynchophorus ferrugineus TaxID=354439 RepID=A0A834I507_RHYFE|nr:hypothetical protein GWI33_014189 [Rhynchophorus ferrugineus]